MKRVSPLSQHIRQFVPLAALGASFLLTLSGCPGGAELEDPAKYGLTGGNSSTGTGGTAPGTGGTGGTGGTTGGSAGTGGGTTLTVDCGSDTYQNVLTKNCASTAGCHKSSSLVPAASMLNLVPDAGLVGRIKDVKALHGDIYMPPDFSTVYVPASCDLNALLVNSANSDASWILAKINGNSNGCGDPMPPGTLPDADKTCLENFVKAVATLPK